MIRTELTLRLQNSPGALARVCDLLSVERVNVSALMMEPTGIARLIVDNPVHAAGLLRDRQYEVEERDVLFTQLPNQPGSFAAIARLLSAASVNLEYVYTATLENQPEAAVVIGVPDAMRAAAAAGL
jgi:hypothetical protein